MCKTLQGEARCCNLRATGTWREEPSKCTRRRRRVEWSSSLGATRARRHEIEVLGPVLQKTIVTTLRRLLRPRPASDSPAGELSIREFECLSAGSAERLLLRDGHPVALTPKAFRSASMHLVDRPGRLVEKRTIIAAVWPDAIVEEGSLASTVSALRKALGDDGDEQHAIATVPTGLSVRHAGHATRWAAVEGPLPHRSTSDGSALWSGVMVAAGWMLAGQGARPPTPVMSVRIGIEPAEGIRGPDLHGERWGWGRPSRTAIAFSPDGQQLIFAGLAGDQQQLWRRSRSLAGDADCRHRSSRCAVLFSRRTLDRILVRNTLWKVPAGGSIAHEDLRGAAVMRRELKEQTTPSCLPTNSTAGCDAWRPRAACRSR